MTITQKKYDELKAYYGDNFDVVDNLIGELQEHPYIHRQHDIICVDGLTHEHVIIDGKAQNCWVAWGIVYQDDKWIFFEADDERGRISYRLDFDTLEEACAKAKEWIILKLDILMKREGKK